MSGRNYMVDAQQALGFLVSQTSYIEPQVVAIQYPDIQYPDLIPVDTSANEWARSITFYSSDRVGKAQWFHHLAKDIAVADVERARYEQGIEMANIGYRYSLEELGVAQLTNQSLTVDRAAAAKRAYEEFVDGVALRGDVPKGLSGIIDFPGITTADAANNQAGTSTDWDDKTADEIAKDVNDALSGVYTGSLTVEMADTILLPVGPMNLLATKRLGDTDKTVLAFLRENNVYTFQTGRPLIIRQVRGLETAGEGGTGRMVVYRRDPAVLKMHIPMTHRFLPPWQTGPLVFDIPGIFRLAGLEVRRPKAIRYVDGISGDNPS